MVLHLLLITCAPAVTDSAFASARQFGVEHQDGGLRVAGTGLGVAPDADLFWTPGSIFGLYESLVFDVGQTARVDSLRWRTRRPAGLPLPDDGAAESVVDGVDMRDNVALYHFDESSWVGAPGEVRDSSGRGHHGTRTDAGAQVVPGGPFGRAASFDRSACVLVPDTPQLRPSSAVTFAAWFLPRVLDGNPQGLIAKRQDFMAPSAHNVFVWTGDSLWVDIDSEDDRFQSPTRLTTGRWYHVAVVFEGALPAARRVRLYLDGRLDTEAFETSPSIPPYDAPLALGCLPVPSSSSLQALDGLLDEAAVWHRALSAEEVAALHRRGTERVLAQLRTCVDATCAEDPPWVGPDGEPDTFFRVGGQVTAPPARYVQYRAWLQNGVELEEVSLALLDESGSCLGEADDAGVPDAGLPGGVGVDAGSAPLPEPGALRLAVGPSCQAAGTEGAFGLVGWLVLRRRGRSRRSRR